MANGAVAGHAGRPFLKALARPRHGYGVLQRSNDHWGRADHRQGALYPALDRLEHQGLLRTEWGMSDNNRKAKFYTLTPAGRRRLKAETEQWRANALAINTALSATEA